MRHDAAWQEIDRLISEQKLEAARERVAALLTEVAGGADAATWTRALIRHVQLGTALGGFETAVRFLKDQPWPGDARSRAILSLFYGHSLTNYLQAYSWEIGQRERIETAGALDLKVMTRGEIAAEAQRAFQEVWRNREAFGEGSVGEFAEYIEQNTYPARLRGTLRDAVTYLWVAQLADSSQWSPRESAEIYKLKLDELLGPSPLPAGADFAREEVHPLRKIAALLADLESWHGAGRRPEAAFEARLERLRQLDAALTTEGDKKRLRQDLEAASARLGKSFEWWSMGRAQLAEWVRATDAPASQAEARKIALAGHEAHPGSVGGKRCQALVREIEAPSFAVTTMSVDAPGRRSLALDHQNLPALHFRAYRLDLGQHIAASRDYNLLPGYREVPDLLRSNRPHLDWSVELPATPDYRTHRTYATPPLTEPGLYVIVASARRDFARSGNVLTSVNLIVSDLTLTSRRLEEAHEVTVRSGATGKAVAGAEVRLYAYDWRNGHRAVETQTTAADGRARFTAAAGRGQQFFLFAEKGKDEVVDLTYLSFEAPPAQQAHTTALIYTDRAIYRPQQDLQWKVVAYTGGGPDGERFRAEAGKRFTVELADPNGQVVASSEVTSNSYGSASGRFNLPTGRLLGSWSLRTSLGGAASVEVEEYKRPTFEVEVTDPASPLRLNRPATLRGSVRYYFGLPVAEGALAWRITREPQFPRWWFWDWRPPGPPQIVASGDAPLGADGTFSLAFTPEADERQAETPGLTYLYKLTAEVTDEGGETRSAEKTFRIGFAAVEATIAREQGFVAAGADLTLTIRRGDLDGRPRAGAGSYRLLALAQPREARLPADQPLPDPPGTGEAERFTTPGDRLRPRWEGAMTVESTLRLLADGEEVRKGGLTHGADGAAALSLAGLPPGAYRLRYETQDEFGAKAEASEELLVGGEAAPAPELPVVLLAEHTTVAVGGKARFLVASGLAEQELTLEIFRGRERLERRLLAADAGSLVLEIPVTEKDRAGLTVAVSGIRDHQHLAASSTITVPRDDRRLELAFATFRDRLRPGTKETWRVTIKGADERAVAEGAAEVLASMYDRSLDLFAPYNPPQPLSLYPGPEGPRELRVSLGSGGAVWQDGEGLFQPLDVPPLSPDRLKFFDDYGIGGPGRAFFADGKRAVMDLAMVAEAPMVEGRAAPRALKSARAEEAVPPPAPPPVAPTAAAAPAATPELRSNFAETAFWYPHLLTGADGSVSFEFTVPDSVTEWNVWVHALTRDLRAGALTRRTASVKELLVRPYVPRFLREGDEAALKVVLNNAADKALAGTLDFEINDPATGESLLAAFGLTPRAAAAQPFEIAPKGSATLTFPLTAPPRVGTVAFKVVARSGDLSDGELRPVPVLPGRLHLAQSRFVTLRGGETKTLRFGDLAADDDPTRQNDQLVVTVDAQLFYGVLGALPYLVNYPYECTEQTLNRFLSTGIVTSLYDQYPAVGKMAAELAQRETRLETFAGVDPNRKMALEETPWLVAAKGGAEKADELTNVLDPRVAKAERAAALARLEQAQTSLGGFPWWPGGPPSPYMTLYLLQGFARAREFGIDVPQEMVVKAWAYMHRHYLEEIARDMMKDDCCWESVTLLAHVLSSFPDEAWTGGVFSTDERTRLLDYSFRHWKEHSPLLKAYLAMTLKRAGRGADAKLVFDSVMDSAKTTDEEGTFWAPEDRAWLWYNDTIETHALALRALTELSPTDARRHGLVHWLFLNKKLNHWKSTRATAEVIYSLAHYLDREGALGAREEVAVTAGAKGATFVFEPERYTGKKNQLVIPGPEIDPKTMAAVEVSKRGKGFAFASATWQFSTDQLPAEERGDFFAVSRTFFRRVQQGEEWVLQPLAEGAKMAVGDQLEVQLSIRAKHAAEYVHLRDPRGAGFEPETLTSGYHWGSGLGWYEEVRDSGTNFFFDWLPAGEYTFKYRLRANLAGTFRVGPATLQSMYAPEFNAYSSGVRLVVAEP